jgi:hypothetical protein
MPVFAAGKLLGMTLRALVPCSFLWSGRGMQPFKTADSFRASATDQGDQVKRLISFVRSARVHTPKSA